MSDLHEKIDFSKTPRLEVRPELFEEMLARRQARTEAKTKLSAIDDAPSVQVQTSAKMIPLPTANLRWKMPMAIAASLLCVVGATIFTLGNSSSPQAVTVLANTATSSFSTTAKPSSSTTAEATEDALAETVDWYGSLGEGGSSEQLVVADAIFQSF